MPGPAECEQLGVELQDLLAPLVPWFTYQDPGMEAAVYDPLPTAPPPDVGPKTSLSVCIHPYLNKTSIM